MIKRRHKVKRSLNLNILPHPPKKWVEKWRPSDERLFRSADGLEVIIIIKAFIYPRALIEKSFWRAGCRRFKINQKLVKNMLK